MALVEERSSLLMVWDAIRNPSSLFFPTTATEKWLLSKRMVTCLGLSSKQRTDRLIWSQVCGFQQLYSLTSSSCQPALQCSSLQESNSLMAQCKNVFLALHPTTKEANAVSFWFFFFFSLLQISHSWQMARWLFLFSLDRKQFPIAFQQSSIEHAPLFLVLSHTDRLPLTQPYRTRSVSVEE